MGKLGIIVRVDDSGLGNQTRNLAYMLKPHKILIIDSTPFNNRKQHFEWYEGWDNKRVSNGFPTKADFDWFLQDVDAILSCEIPYGYQLFSMAKEKGVETYLQYNYEFLDYLQNKTLPQPTALISPSVWGMSDVENRTGMSPRLLRPPLFLNDYSKNSLQNCKRIGTRRILHIAGYQAIHDRNGTEDLIKAAVKSKSYFHLVIKAQSKLPYEVNDSRIIFDYSSPEDNTLLYHDFDAMILPRRYGGLCLPMNEALASSLPVIMTDINPNNSLLPYNWLVKATKKDEFMTRTMIDIYESDIDDLMDKIDFIANIPDPMLLEEKQKAFEIAYNNFNHYDLVDKYKSCMNL